MYKHIAVVGNFRCKSSGRKVNKYRGSGLYNPQTPFVGYIEAYILQMGNIHFYGLQATKKVG